MAWISRPFAENFSFLAIAPMLIGAMGLVAAFIWSIAKAGFSRQHFQLKSIFFTEDMASYLPLALNSLLLAISASTPSVTVVFLLSNEQGTIGKPTTAIIDMFTSSCASN